MIIIKRHEISPPDEQRRIVAEVAQQLSVAREVGFAMEVGLARASRSAACPAHGVVQD